MAKAGDYIHTGKLQGIYLGRERTRRCRDRNGRVTKEGDGSEIAFATTRLHPASGILLLGFIFHKMAHDLSQIEGHSSGHWHGFENAPTVNRDFFF